MSSDPQQVAENDEVQHPVLFRLAGICALGVAVWWAIESPHCGVSGFSACPGYALSSQWVLRLERGVAALVGLSFIAAFVIRVLLDGELPTDFSRDGIGWRRNAAATGIDSLSDAVDAVERRLDRVEEDSREARTILLEQLEGSDDLGQDSIGDIPGIIGRSILKRLGVHLKP